MDSKKGVLITPGRLNLLSVKVIAHLSNTAAQRVSPESISEFLSSLEVYDFDLTVAEKLQVRAFAIVILFHTFCFFPNQ